MPRPGRAQSLKPWIAIQQAVLMTLYDENGALDRKAFDLAVDTQIATMKRRGHLRPKTRKLTLTKQGEELAAVLANAGWRQYSAGDNKLHQNKQR